MSTTGATPNPADPRDAAIARIRAKRHVWTSAASFVVLELIFVAIWALGHHGFFWPIWPAVGFALALAGQAYQAYGGGRITEEQIQREMENG
jgi:hypothetical protein